MKEFELQAHAEVDDLRERYSAKRFVAHLKAAMNGDRKGFGEWQRVIRSMQPDDAALFWMETDALIELGELVHVLTPEQVEEARAKILENIEEWRALSNGLMSDKGVPSELMHRVAPQGDRPMDEANDIARQAEADMIALLDDMDEADAYAWAEPEDMEAAAEAVRRIAGKAMARK